MLNNNSNTRYNLTLCSNYSSNAKLICDKSNYLSSTKFNKLGKVLVNVNVKL